MADVPDPQFAEQIRQHVYDVLRDVFNLPEEFTSHMLNYQLVNGRVNEANLSFFDTTAADASADQHGLLPKLSGNPAHSLRGDGTWA